MEILELAAQLGQIIKEDSVIKRFNTAKEAYLNDSDIQKAILEYNVQQTALTEEYKKGDPDSEMIGVIEKRIDELYHQVTENPIFEEYSTAQTEANLLMKNVNDEITFQITGQRPEECGSDCAACGGSCGHSH